jgi:F-type H+-transporting ATPase subunit delta
MAARFTRPYVDALFSVAGSSDAVERLLPTLESFAKTLHSSPVLRAVLRNPGIERERKNALLAAIAAREGIDALGTRLLTTLLGNGRLLSLGELLTAARERIDRERNVVEAKVTSAIPLDAAAAARIKAALETQTKKNVRLKSDVDPALLGGFVVRVGSEIYDTSLASRLERARRALHASDTTER